jgi:hypothetical protein
MYRIREKKLEEKNSKLQRQLEQSGKEIKSLKSRLSAGERTRKLLPDDIPVKKSSRGSISLQPVKRHQFPGFTVSLSVLLHVRTDCGFRGAVTIPGILKELLGWGAVDIPTRNTIENRVKRSVPSVYKASQTRQKEKDYAMIVDESMMPAVRRCC